MPLLSPEAPVSPPLSVLPLLVVAIAILPVFVAPQAPVAHDRVGEEAA